MKFLLNESFEVTYPVFLVATDDNDESPLDDIANLVVHVQNEHEGQKISIVPFFTDRGNALRFVEAMKMPQVGKKHPIRILTIETPRVMAKFLARLLERNNRLIGFDTEVHGGAIIRTVNAIDDAIAAIK